MFSNKGHIIKRYKNNPGSVEGEQYPRVPNNRSLLGLLFF